MESDAERQRRTELRKEGGMSMTTPDLSVILRAKTLWAERAHYIEKHPEELMRWRTDEFIAEYAAMFVESEMARIAELCEQACGEDARLDETEALMRIWQLVREEPSTERKQS